MNERKQHVLKFRLLCPKIELAFFFFNVIVFYDLLLKKNNYRIFSKDFYKILVENAEKDGTYF